MGNIIATLLDSNSDSTSEPRLINSETDSRILNMEEDSIIDDYTKGIRTENGNRMGSKKTLVLLDKEEKSMHDDPEKQTENLNCKLPDILQTEESVQHISNRTQTACTKNKTKLDKAKSNTSKHTSMDKHNESAEQNINNAVSQCKGLKRANSNTTKNSPKRAKSSQPTISKSKDTSEKNMKVTVTFSTQFTFNTNSTLQCMESLISRRRIIYAKRQAAREKLAIMENEALHNIRKQRKKKVRRPRTKKVNPTFSSIFFFNSDSNIQCMESIIQRRKIIFNKKQEELKKCKQNKKDRKQKPKTNKRKAKKGSKQSKSQNNNKLHNKDKNLPFVQQSDTSYCSSCIFCNKYHEYHQANTCSPKQCKEKFSDKKKKESSCVVM